MGELIGSGAATGHSFTKNPAVDLLSQDRTFLDKVASDSTTIGRFNLDNLDVSDVDSLFAFFSAQMTEAKGDVANMMRDQEARNQKVRDLQGLATRFTQWEANGVPVDKRAEFLAAGEELMNALPPGSKEAQTIGAVLDAAKAGTDYAEEVREVEHEGESQVSAEDAANALREVHVADGSRVEKSKDANGKAVYTVHWQVNGPPISADQVKSITASVKSVTDGLVSDSTMAMIRIQTGVERMSQITNLCTNVLKKHNDAEDSVISNLR